MKTWRRTLILAVVLVVVGIQFVPVSRENPATDPGDEIASPVDDILRRSCFDCHSNRTDWPWYSRVAPVSWLVAHDVEEGREHLNFSAWNRLPESERRKLAEEAVEEVGEGAMPLPIYLNLHRDAEVSAADLVRLRGWARSLGAGGGTTEIPEAEAEVEPDPEDELD